MKLASARVLSAVRVFAVATLFLRTAVFAAAEASDPYESYLRQSEDFRAVKQEAAWATRAFPSWTLMPWTFRWTIGYSQEAGEWSVAHGYNGAFIDRGQIEAEGSPTGRLDWIQQFGLRFYMDHTANKGFLHLWDGSALKPHLAEVHGTGLRPVPLNAALRRKLGGIMRENVQRVQGSPQRAAYALDDEVSWGHFVHPTMWRITDDAAAYPRWLREVYGAAAPAPGPWRSYEELRPKLATWSVRDFDVSPLLDQWSFNDSYWANFIGGLVEDANAIDPATPCGLVGGQMPSPFGGYDYAKLMRKVQFLEAYNQGSSQAIIRSFNPHNALPAVTSLFHLSAADDIWQTWYYLAHGNRGHIAWVDGWFDGKTPKPWHDEVAPAFLEAGGKIGPLLTGAEWHDDGIALLYNHASIQLGWILDAEAHGRTWTNRNSDGRLSSSANVRRAWENMLRDEGLQYTWLSYVDLVRTGVPAGVKVLVLPACLCLSDAEARAIRAFCQRGGTVIADYLPGLWDQHGKGRAEGGVLDDLFGLRHDPAMKAADVFGEKLWVEVNQDANYSPKTEREFLTNRQTSLEEEGGFHRAVRKLPIATVRRAGAGTAVLMNLSPQWYNASREEGAAAAANRATFMRHVRAAGVRPWVELKERGDAVHGAEITCWNRAARAGRPGRQFVFLCFNPATRVSSEGGGNAVGLKTDSVPVTLRFATPVRAVRNERTGENLGAGQEFKAVWKMNEAVVLSFDLP